MAGHTPQSPQRCCPQRYHYQAQLQKLRDTHALPFTLLSDPTLESAEPLGMPVSTRAAYLSALALDPVVRKLPQKAYLQPALFVWRSAALVYAWRQTETLRNLLGAKGRPSPKQILDLTRQALTE